MSAFEPSDGIAETVERQLQVTVAAATVSARAIAARRHQALREAQQHSEDAARALRARHGEERQLAAARLAPVFDDAWWETAGPQEIAAMWHEATSWATGAEDPAAGAVAVTPSIFDHAVGRISSEVHERSGLDVADLALLAELQQLEREHQTGAAPSDAAATERASERSEHPALADPSLAAPAADRAPAAADVQPAASSFDDPQRRERLRERLALAGVPEDAIQARVLADIGQAREPAHATRNASQATTTVQRPPGRKIGEQRHRHR
jgi:colicin import membrane protein